MISGWMPVTDAELISLAASHDIITIGALADELRRERHGTRTTFVRVAEVPAAADASLPSPASAGSGITTGHTGSGRPARSTDGLSPSRSEQRSIPGRQSSPVAFHVTTAGG